MRLELHKVHIKGLDFAEKTHVKNGVLYVNKEEAEALVAEDRNFSKVSIDFARPGEKTRIIPVKDAVEPRVKIGKGNYFPGFMAPMEKAGNGETLVLAGAARQDLERGAAREPVEGQHRVGAIVDQVARLGFRQEFLG